jgi:hypothetical protein
MVRGNVCITLFFAVREQERSGCMEELWLCNFTQHMGSPESKHFPEQRIFWLMVREEGIQDAAELHGCGA